MASPRPPKDEPGQPNSLQVGGGGGASSDRILDIYQKVAGIERSVTYLEAHAQNTDSKLNAISEDVVAAKATFNTLKWVLGIAGTLLVLLWTFTAGLLTLAAKHYLKW